MEHCQWHAPRLSLNYGRFVWFVGLLYETRLLLSLKLESDGAMLQGRARASKTAVRLGCGHCVWIPRTLRLPEPHLVSPHGKWGWPQGS